MRMTKNQFVPFCFLFLIFAIACSKNTDTTSSSSSGAYNPTVVDVPCTGTQMEKVVCAAELFLSKLSSSQQSVVKRTYTLTEAKKWSNLPNGLNAIRVGLPFRSLTAEQVQYAKALVKLASGIPILKVLTKCNRLSMQMNI